MVGLVRGAGALMIALVVMPAEPAHAATCPVATIREAVGSNAATIQGTVDAFRADLGDPNNGAAIGSQGAGRREINWDGVPDADAANSRFPGDFFNTVSPRGVLFEADSFQVSADSANPAATSVEFGNLNASYPTAFGTFSAQRLFTPLDDSVFRVQFVVPGGSEPAGVTGFGAVFVDVDSANETAITFLDPVGVPIFSRNVLAAGNSNGFLSFVGVTFVGPCVGSVEITAGNGAVLFTGSPNDLTQGGANDIVVLDDFIYGEPQPLVSTVGIGPGSKKPRVQLFNGVDGSTDGPTLTGDSDDTKGVPVAVGDVSGDGVPDLITGAGPKTPPYVRVFDGVSGLMIHEFLAYKKKFEGGVFVAAGNINGDANLDIITGPGKGGVVKVFNGADPSVLLGSLEAYEGKLRRGVRVAAGDINGDFLDDVVTVPGKGKKARVRAFSATQLNDPAALPLLDFVALPGKKGVFLALGDISGDGVLDFVLGRDKDSPPEVWVIDGVSLEPLESLFGGFLAYPDDFRGGVPVAAGDVNGNGTTDIVTGTGRGRNSETTLRVFDPSGAAGGPLSTTLPYGPGDERGVFVGVADR